MAATPYAQANSFPGVVVANAAALRAVPSNLFIDGGSSRIYVSPGSPTDYIWSATSILADNGTTVIQPADVSGAGRWLEFNGAGGGITPPAGDIGGTVLSPTVQSIQGLPTSPSAGAAFNEVLAVINATPWLKPVDVAYDGTNLWVADGLAQAGVVYVFKVNPGTFAVTAYAMPASTAACERITSDGTNVYVLVATASGHFDRLVILSAATGAVIGLGKWPSTSVIPTGLCLDGTGQVWAADRTNGAQGFNIAALLAAYPTDVAPAHTFALANAFDVASDGTYVYVSGGTGAVIDQITLTGTLHATYTDLGGRNLGYLFWNASTPGGADLFCTTTTHLLRIATAAMTLVVDIAAAGPNLAALRSIGFDGTYLYVTQTANGYVELYNPATNLYFNEFNASNVQGAASGGGVVEQGAGVVWTTVPTTVPGGNAGIQSFGPGGPSSGFSGNLAIGYKPLPPVTLLYLVPTNLLVPTPQSGWVTYSSSTAGNQINWEYQDTTVPFTIHPTKGLTAPTYAAKAAAPGAGTTQFAFDIAGPADVITAWSAGVETGKFLHFSGTEYQLNSDAAYQMKFFGSSSTVTVELTTSQIAMTNGSITLNVLSAGVALGGGYFDLLTSIATPANPGSGYRMYVDGGTGDLMVRSSTGVVTQLAPTATATPNYRHVTHASSPVTAVANDRILCDTSSGAISVTVPITAGAQVIVKKTTADANAVTITPASGTIDGGATATLSALNNSYDIEGDGTNAWIFG